MITWLYSFTPTRGLGIVRIDFVSDQMYIGSGGCVSMRYVDSNECWRLY